MAAGWYEGSESGKLRSVRPTLPARGGQWQMSTGVVSSVVANGRELFLSHALGQQIMVVSYAASGAPSCRITPSPVARHVHRTRSFSYNLTVPPTVALPVFEDPGHKPAAAANKVIFGRQFYFFDELRSKFPSCSH